MCTQWLVCSHDNGLLLDEKASFLTTFCMSDEIKFAKHFIEIYEMFVEKWSHLYTKMYVNRSVRVQSFLRERNKDS